MSSPLEIELLLHYWCSATDHPHVAKNLGLAWREAADRFVERGLLRRADIATEGRLYTGVSEALEPYVNALTAVPFPVQQWILPLQDSGDNR
jgi:hypothetical protein